MVNFPFYRYPYPYYYRNQKSSNFHNANYKTNFENIPNNLDISKNDGNEKREVKDKVQVDKTQTSRYNSFGPILFQNPFSVETEEPILEILGIKLYLDDIIILGLLFFLYKEGVKDEILFLSLILLLLS